MDTNGDAGACVDPGWAHIEFEHIDLGDARIERRLRVVAEELSGQPEYPINHASEDAAATKAAYRLFNNERVTAERIIAPHRSRTLQRMRAEPIVLAIQDTTYFNFTSHKKTRGLGPIGCESAALQGLLLHSTLAVTPHGLPLGLLSQRCWARDGFCQSNLTCESRPLHEKESYRWVEALTEVTELPCPDSTAVVHVADRECDIYEFLREAHGLRAKYVIRACSDRVIESDEYRSVQSRVDALPTQAIFEINVPTEKRHATLSLKFVQVTLQRPPRVPKVEQIELPCWVVYVVEEKPPSQTNALSWTLLTNVPVLTVEHALERVAWYRKRWAIEEFHKILKSGCTIEDCRLQTADRLKRFITLFCVTAWRIFWLTHIQRADPNAPAEVALTQAEIGTLTSLRRFQPKLAPNKTLTVRQAIIAIACLGGYLNRKNDPPPGPTALWRGWQRLSSMSELYESIIPGCG